jgi:GNAT superfamily N-acetyltransferase
MKIRKGSKSDWKDLLKILLDTSELQAGDGVGVYDKNWIKDVLTKSEDNFVLIVEEEGKIEGFILAHYLKSVKQVILNDMYVSPNYRKKGIAIKLISEMEKIARKKKAKNITGLVQISNKKMQHLFGKLNYKKGEALYFYEKVLK